MAVCVVLRLSVSVCVCVCEWFFSEFKSREPEPKHGDNIRNGRTRFTLGNLHDGLKYRRNSV